jgi:Ca2+-binding EF-hand superfamily protein
MGNSSSGKHLRPEVLGDLAEATSFSEQDIREWHRTFMKDFPSGYLGIDQFKDVYIQHFPNGDATKFAEHVFRTFDRDVNHKLDFREFLTAVSITAKGGPEERLRWAFRMYDIDESGFVSKEECEEIIAVSIKHACSMHMHHIFTCTCTSLHPHFCSSGVEQRCWQDRRRPGAVGDRSL